MNGDCDNALWLDLIRQQVRTLEFGIVQIVVHDSRVVRIERTEKFLVPQEAGQKCRGEV